LEKIVPDDFFETPRIDRRLRAPGKKRGLCRLRQRVASARLHWRFFENSPVCSGLSPVLLEPAAGEAI